MTKTTASASLSCVFIIKGSWQKFQEPWPNFSSSADINKRVLFDPVHSVGVIYTCTSAISFFSFQFSSWAKFLHKNIYSSNS
jgi:hypothetical protein